MNKTLPVITLHGHLGDVFRKVWTLDIKSVSEAIHAINVLSKSKFYKYLYDKDKEGCKYQLIINGELYTHDGDLNAEKIKNSELTIKRTIKTIDIVPMIEGSDTQAGGLVATILGAILIIIGIVLLFIPGAQPGTALAISVGLTLLGAGIAVLLMKPPDEPEDNSKSRRSYLINGATNGTREGGPVPIGYGRLLVGSETIAVNLSSRDYYLHKSKSSGRIAESSGGGTYLR